MRNHTCLSLLLLLPACSLQTQDGGANILSAVHQKNHYKSIEQIPAPAGFFRIPVEGSSFGGWLRSVRLKVDNRVFLYNGSLKADQSAQFAVLDIPVGKRDLQQCADAVIRLRAEYFFSKLEFDSIHFTATDGTELSFVKWRKGARYKQSGQNLKMIFSNTIPANLKTDFENYLETVFSYAGTCSLATELEQVVDIKNIQPGDIFIKPGFPGHAMIVTDVVINEMGKKMFMLAQGYMPAQDIHVVKNHEQEGDAPWYEIPASGQVVTPGWTFTGDQLKRWK